MDYGNSVKFAYLRDPKNPERVLTFCMKWIHYRDADAPSEPAYQTIQYSLAVCNPDVGERFSRKIGRNITFGRLIDGDYEEISKDSKSFNLMQVAQHAAEINSDATVRRICKHWLQEQEMILKTAIFIVDGREEIYDHQP